MSCRTVRQWQLVMFYRKVSYMTTSIMFYGTVSHIAISNVLHNSKAMTIIFYGKVSYMTVSNVLWNSKSHNHKQCLT
jgi:Na+/H+ antiporter NhaC